MKKFLPINRNSNIEVPTVNHDIPVSKRKQNEFSVS